MPTAATPPQIQNMSDQVIRPVSEAIVVLANRITQFQAQFGDVYLALTTTESGWTDARTDSPPHLATASDLLGANELFGNVLTAIKNDGQWPVVQNLVVQENDLVGS